MQLQINTDVLADSIVALIFASLKTISVNSMLSTDKEHGTFENARTYRLKAQNEKGKGPRPTRLPVYKGLKKALYFQYILQSAGISLSDIDKLNLRPYIEVLFQKGPLNQSPTYRICVIITNERTMNTWLDPSSSTDPMGEILASLSDLSSTTYGAAQRVSQMRFILKRAGYTIPQTKASTETAESMIKHMMRVRLKWADEPVDMLAKIVTYKQILSNTPAISPSN